MGEFHNRGVGRDWLGWGKASACDAAILDVPAMATRAARKACASAQPKELPPGRYTVILEPAAVLDLVGQMFGDFSATAIEDGRSFLTGRAKDKLFGDNIHIADDVYHPAHAGAPFDGEGVPKQRLALVESGAVRQSPYSRQAPH